MCPLDTQCHVMRPWWLPSHHRRTIMRTTWRWRQSLISKEVIQYKSSRCMRPRHTVLQPGNAAQWRPCICPTMWWTSSTSTAGKPACCGFMDMWFMSKQCCLSRQQPALHNPVYGLGALGAVWTKQAAQWGATHAGRVRSHPQDWHLLNPDPPKASQGTWRSQTMDPQQRSQVATRDATGWRWTDGWKNGLNAFGWRHNFIGRQRSGARQTRSPG